MPANHKKTTKKSNHKIVAPRTHFLINKNTAILIFIAILVTFNILLITFVFKLQNLQSAKSSIVKVNQSKIQDNIVIKVSGVKTESNYIMGIKPSEGEKIISAKIEITNNSSQLFEFYPSIQTFVRDNQGVTYNMAPVELSDPFAAAVINPGESKSGQVSYLVTDRTIPLFLYIESRQDSSAPFVVKIQ